MSIETHQLVNGQYVPRRISIHEIINHSRESGRHTSVEQHVPRTTRAELGLISRTLVRSPAIKWIFTARLRHADLNDLVFVGEDYIQIMNIQFDGHLKPVGIKADFGSRIRSACVFGKRLEDEELSEVSRIKFERGSSPPPVDGSNLLAAHGRPPQVLVLSLTSGELRFLFSAASTVNGSLKFFESSVALPMQTSLFQQPGKLMAVDPFDRALAVASDSGTVLVYRLKGRDVLDSEFESDSEDWTPVAESMAFPVDATLTRMEFLRPNSGDADQVILLLFGASQGTHSCIFCYEWSHSRPLRHYRPVLNGYKLDKRAAHPDLIIPRGFTPSFLLLSHHDIFLFENILSGSPTLRRVSGPGPFSAPNRWARSESLPVFTAWAKAHRHHPSWIRTMREVFYLVREDGVLNSLEVQTGGLVSMHPAGHASCHASTAFACFIISDSWKDPDMFVIGGDMSHGEVLSIGALPENFNVRVNENLTRTEVMTPRKHETLLNWSPVLDQILVPPHAGSSWNSPDRDSICFTSGFQPFGAISELRIGVEALVTTYTPMTDLGMDPAEIRGATGLWIVPMAAVEDILVFISFPDMTIIFSNERENTDFVDSSGAVSSEETLLVCRVADDCLVQVTLKSVGLLGGISYTEVKDDGEVVEGEESASYNLGSFDHREHLQLPAGCTILLAVFEESSSLLFTVLRTATEQVLQMHDCMPRSGAANKLSQAVTVALDYAPTSGSTFVRASKTYLIVGSHHDELYMYSANSNELVQVGKLNIHPAPELVSPSGVESTAVLESSRASTSEQDIIMLCGLRDGTLHVIPFRFNSDEQDEISYGSRTNYVMGVEAVKLLPASHSDPNYIIAVCGADVVRLSYEYGREEGLAMSSVWFINKEKESEPQPDFIRLCYTSVRRKTSHGTSNQPLIAGLTASQLIVAALDDVVKPLPRRRLLEADCFQVEHTESAGLPRVLLYTPSVDVLIVGTAIWQHKYPKKLQAPLPMHTGKRVLRPGLCIAPAHNSKSGDGSKSDNVIEPIPIFHLFARQRILAMTFWTYQSEHLVVGTAVYKKDQPVTGDIIFFKVSRKNGDVELTLEKESKILTGPVRALASFPNAPDSRPSSTNPPKLVVCVDKSLKVYAYIPELGKLRPQRSVDLPSPAIHITCHSPYIYVTTASDSLQIYELSVADTDRLPTYKLKLVASDRIARHGSCHIALTLPATALLPSDAPRQGNESEQQESLNLSDSEVPNIVLTADKSGNVVGLEPSYGQTYQIAARILFEAALPQYVTKFVQGNIRPPWRRIHNKGMLADNIVGSAADGTFYSFCIVDSNSRVLLKFLENLCTWDHQVRHIKLRMSGKGHSGLAPGITSSSPNKPQVTIDPERGPAMNSGLLNERRANNHINGDTLERFLEVGGRQLLMDMLEREFADDDPSERYRGNNKEARIRRFREIVEAAKGGQFETAYEAIDWTVEWLRDSLRPLL